MKKFKLLFFVVAICGHALAQTIAIPDGYAGYAKTTGGGSAEPVIISSADEFKTAVNNSEPAVIVVKGLLNVGLVQIGSNKTIVGADSLSGLYGGTIKIGGTNCIMQNLTLGPSNEDVLEISGATKIFITKCTFHDSKDELCSVVRESDNVTISWCRFYFDNPNSHSFAHLIGNSDTRTTDRGKLHVTLHHNWYDYGVQGRMPRVRFGHVHIYNNYYNSKGSGYCVGVGKECNIKLENTCFEDINEAWADYGGTTNGEIGWNNLIFINCKQPTFVKNSYPVFTPPYVYNLDRVENVKNMVKGGAGNVFGNVGTYSHLIIKNPPDSAKFENNSTILIETEIKDSDDSLISVSFFRDALLATDTIAPFSFEMVNLETGKYKIWLIGNTAGGQLLLSREHTIYVGTAASITNPKQGSKHRVPSSIPIFADAWKFDGSISTVDFYEGENLIGTDFTEPYLFNWENAPQGTYMLTVVATDNEGNTIKSDEITIEVAGGPEGYDFCTYEGDECKTDKLINIAFGADGKFNYLYNVSGEIDCSASAFGGDPNPSASKACYVQDAPTPYVELVFPASGKEYSASAKVEFYAKAYDNDGTIDSVEFYSNDKIIGLSKLAENNVASYVWDYQTDGEFNITAKVTDNDGNEASSNAIQITILGGTSVPNFGDVLEVYPNPVSGVLKLKMSSIYSGETVLTLSDSRGMAIKSSTFLGKEYLLDISDVPSGIYFVTLLNDKGQILKKIIKR